MANAWRPPTVLEPGQPVTVNAASGEPIWFPGIERALYRTFAGGALIYGHGDTTTGLYLLESGRVKLYRLTVEGREAPLIIIDPGQTFGEEAVVGLETRTHFAEACQPSRVRVVGPAQVAAWTTSRPDVVLAITRILWARLEGLGERLENLAFHHAPYRLARFLLYAARQYGEPTRAGTRLPSALTHQAIANCIGTQRETVTQALGELRTAGLLLRDPARRRSLVLPDLARLAWYADEAASPRW